MEQSDARRQEPQRPYWARAVSHAEPAATADGSALCRQAEVEQMPKHDASISARDPDMQPTRLLVRGWAGTAIWIP